MFLKSRSLLPALLKKGDVLDCIEKGGWEISSLKDCIPLEMTGGVNSNGFCVGEFYLKELLQEELQPDSEMLSVRYLFFDQLSKVYPQAYIPMKRKSGERYFIQNDRVYELIPLVQNGEGFIPTTESIQEFARELGRFHSATRKVSDEVAILLAAQDPYRDAISFLQKNLKGYRGKAQASSDDFSRQFLFRYDDIEEMLAGLLDSRLDFSAAEQAILHRDLHPGNLLTQTGAGTPSVVFIDFDAAIPGPVTLDLVFAIDRITQTLGLDSQSEISKVSDQFFCSYLDTFQHESDKVIVSPNLVLAEEYLKRLSSILGKHYLLNIPQSIENFKRQDLSRVKYYEQLGQ